MEQALTIKEVCDLLKCSPDTLYAMIASKKIAAVKVGRRHRIFPEAIEAYKRGETVEQARQRVARRPGLPEWARNVPRMVNR